MRWPPFSSPSSSPSTHPGPARSGERSPEREGAVGLRRPAARTGALLGLVVGLLAAGSAAAVSTTEDTRFTLGIDTADFGLGSLTTEFSRVTTFSFEIDLRGPLAPDRIYGNGLIEEVRYLVRGSLETSPPTPSGFSAFALNRRVGGEGPISLKDWIGQGSFLRFRTSPDAVLADGLQLSDLVPLKEGGALLVLDAREFERLDRARYHPPQLQLFSDGTGLLRNSNNSSGSTGTVNPATGLEVDVDFGEEYVTRIAFDPAAVTLVEAGPGTVVPEPATALLLGLGLAGLASLRRVEDGRARTPVG